MTKKAIKKIDFNQLAKSIVDKVTGEMSDRDKKQPSREAKIVLEKK